MWSSHIIQLHSLSSLRTSSSRLGLRQDDSLDRKSDTGIIVLKWFQFNKRIKPRKKKCVGDMNMTLVRACVPISRTSLRQGKMSLIIFIASK